VIAKGREAISKPCHTVICVSPVPNELGVNYPVLSKPIFNIV